MARNLITLPDAAISRLAREIARDILPLDEILKTYRLTAEDYDQVVDSKFFQVRLAEEIQLWNASDPLSIAKRIETKAATLVEDCLLEAYALVHDREQPMAAKVEMLKWAARMAGMGETGRQGASDGGGVKITINVGTSKLEFDKENTVLPRAVTDVIDLTPDKT
jgi:hypothetical protein